jgi:hypothetical protein
MAIRGAANNPLAASKNPAISFVFISVSSLRRHQKAGGMPNIN